MADLMRVFNDKLQPRIRDTANRSYRGEVVHFVDVR